jgi:hypothetical protein
MQWVEIIHLYAASVYEHQRVRDLFRRIKSLLGKDEQYVSMRLFKDANNPCVFTIVLEWKCDDWNFTATPLKSAPGMKLADKLKEIGLVRHTLAVDGEEAAE